MLDVKTGAGAFLPPIDQGRELAKTMVGIGERNGVRTVALITDMEWPLGLAAGNGVEVAESVEVLAGGGPTDVVELTLALAEEMCRARRPRRSIRTTCSPRDGRWTSGAT